MVLALALVAPLGLEAPALAASSSVCSACENEDPNTWRVWTGPYDYYLCATDAITVDTIPHTRAPSKYVELRYSPRCRTVWARSVGSGFEMGVERLSPARTLSCCAASSTDQSSPPKRWTNMLDDAGVVSRAYMYDGTTQYTKWY